MLYNSLKLNILEENSIMRFKSMLKKSSAVMASLVIFCSALPCRAMVPFGSGDDRGYILDAPRFERDVVCPDIPDEARLEHMIETFLLLIPV